MLHPLLFLTQKGFLFLSIKHCCIVNISFFFIFAIIRIDVILYIIRLFAALPIKAMKFDLSKITQFKPFFILHVLSKYNIHVFHLLLLYSIILKQHLCYSNIKILSLLAKCAVRIISSHESDNWLAKAIIVGLYVVYVLFQNISVA